MKKVILALATAAAFGAVQAQTNVSLTGRASMEVSNWSATGATAGASNDLRSRMRVADSGSRITFAVREDLGQGLAAGIYCETGINIDSATNTNQAGTANSATSEWCSREGRVSLGNNTAEVRLGYQNVYWTQGQVNSTGSQLIGQDVITQMLAGGAGYSGPRLGNTVMVNANSAFGKFAGSQLYYSLPSAAESVAANTDASAKIYGGKLNYVNGAILGMIDYQIAGDTTAGAANSLDRRNVKYGLGYKYGGESVISLQYWDHQRSDITTGGAYDATAAKGNAKNTGVGINLNHDLGGGLIAVAQYVKTSNVTGGASNVEIDGTGATGFQVGAVKRLSKRTHLYGHYQKIDNGSAAAYSMTGGGYNSVALAAGQRGTEVKAIAVGMIHNF
jgi:predicted porin